MFAQQHTLEVSQYAHTSWTARDGFFKGTGSVAQTSDGYIWITSPSGLLRFDGVRFFEWKPPANDSLPLPPLYQLLGSKDGSLWIGGTGLAQLKADGEFRRYHQLDDLQVLTMIEDKDGAIWAGGDSLPHSSKLCRIYREKSECFPATGFLTSATTGLYEDEKGQLLAATMDGFWRIRPEPAQKLAPNSLQTRVFGEDASGALIFSGGPYLQMVTPDGKIKPYPIRIDHAFNLLKDREGDLWFGTAGQGIVHVHEGRVDRFSSVDGLSYDDVSAIFEDREGNVWATTGNGLDKFTRPAIATMARKQGLQNDNIASVFTDHNGASWVGTSSGLYGLINDHLIKSTIKLPDYPLSFFGTSKGRTLVATNTLRGMVWLDGNKATRLPTAVGDNVFEIAEDRRGDLWVMSRELGLLHLRGDGTLVETFYKELGRFRISLAYDPQRDGFWLTSYLGDLGFFKDGKIVEKYGSSDGLGKGVVHDPQVDQDGGVWAAARTGLAHLINGKMSVLNRKNGLPCDAVHWMRRDQDHNVWLYAECGLVSFSESDLSSWTADPSHTVAITHYLDNTDGVENAEFNGWYTPQTATTGDGRILFATTTGLSILDPRNLNQNTSPPPVHIEEITADEREIRSSGRISLPPRVHSVHIAFTALSFAAPRKVLFRYRLQGYDTDWSAPGSLRQASYTNLPPGNYAFRVIACNNDGLWNTTGDTLSFFIPPAFYQTLWFKLLIATVICGLLWTLYLLRLKQATANVQKRLLAQVEERERIARELHDTLLQGFQGITLRMQGVAKNMLVQDPLRKMMEEVLDRGDEVMRDARQRVRNLRRRTTDENELAGRLTKYGEELSQDHAASFALAIVGTPRTLQSTVQDEAYRIAAEALTNAFRHASAAKIEAEVTYDSSALRIRIRDDGVGIQNAVLVNGQPGHWGLAGMRERAQALGAELNIWSREAAGTEVELVIPASIAYPREQTKAG